MQSPLLFPQKNTAVSFAKHSFLRVMLLCIGCFAFTAAYAQLPFISTWKTDNPGTSSSTSITIPTTGAGYNYEVDWNNDGTYDESGLTGNVTHDFGVAGTYTIRIRGTFPRIYFNNAGDRRKLLGISQWGSIAWTSMNSAFRGCANLNISATDLPDLSGVTDMSRMFEDCANLNGPANIGSWNTAGVTTMQDMFHNAYDFNQPIGTWNTANVTNMSSMFFNDAAFNQPIGSWNTSSVTDMFAMFYAAFAFNQTIGNWNTANVTNMRLMFNNALAFNQPIGNWNTANVTNMSNMFFGARLFNQPIGNWSTTNVTNMGGMFQGAAAFNQTIGNWNTANVTNMRLMFEQAGIFNQPIGNWNTANVTDMGSMLSRATAFNQPIGNWNTANVTDMSFMFSSATAFNQYIGAWTLNAAVDLTSMLNSSGMNCDYYSATLVGWSANPNTPNGRTLGATGRQYGTSAAAARTNLDVTKTWTITGDAASGAACGTVLPVTLLRFSGKLQENGILLDWQTASEENNQGFYVERSADGLRWTDIGFVAGKGTTNETQNYSFLDLTPLQGGRGVRVYYRLRQTDFNGKEEVSNVVSIELKNAGTVRVFPNPVSNGELTLFLSENTEEEITVQLFSPMGQLLHSMTLKKGNNSLNVSKLPTGIYTLQMGHSFEKIVVQN